MVRTHFQPGQLPMDFLLPETHWVRPTELPDLRGRGLIAIDTETKDDGLANDRGAGWAYGTGFIAGVSASVEGQSVYVPVRHPETDCFDHDAVGRWLDDLMHCGEPVVFHKADYDLGWIGTEWGIKPPEKIHDSLCGAVMVDENRLSYDLTSVSRWLGRKGKNEDALRQAAAAYGFDPKKDLWRMPARFAGVYAEVDAVETRENMKLLIPQMEAQGTLAAYETEMGLIPMVIAMRRQGIQIDMDQAVRTQRDLARQRDEALSELSRQLAIGRQVGIKDIGSVGFLERVFDDAGIKYPKTPKNGRGSFEAEWMEKLDHWLPRLVTRAKKLHDASDKFVGKYILEFAHMGRLHAEIHQFRSDDGGTRSHRMSYSDPPLQQMPSRAPDIAHAIRQCFRPDEGCVWAAPDYSQQEFRLIVHYAFICHMQTAETAVAKYVENPDTDFHNLVVDMTGLERRKAKDVNFAKAFGAGTAKFALMTGMALDEAGAVMKQYDDLMPFVSRLGEFCQARADQRGWIQLIDGSRSHFDQWEPRWRDRDKEREVAALGVPINACSLEEAERRVKDPSHPWKGRVRRAYTHKAMNRLIQGSAARQTKLAMLSCWREGIMPILQMHDELCFSVSEARPAERAAEIMRDVVKLVVPVKIDLEYGPTWGDAKALKRDDKSVYYDASFEAAQRWAQSGEAPRP